jgi:homoserine kinase type II
MAVYTEVADEDLRALAARYGLGAIHSCKGIAEGVENTNYLLDTDRGRFILTLYERRVARADLPFFLGLMEHLDRAGLTCPRPVRDRHGESLGEIAGRPAALVTFLDGVWTRSPTPAHCREVGAVLARLHLAACDFKLSRANALGKAGWRPLYERFAPRAEEIVPGLAATIEAELAALDRTWPDALPAGVIHGDLFPDNVFFLGERLSGIIDFYFACNDAWAYDLAVALNAWCFTRACAFVPERAAALLAGYEGVRRLEAAERDAIPVLARGSALRFLLTRSYDWINTAPDALVVPHDPNDFLKRLRFHQQIATAAGYGLGAAP